MKRAQKKAIIRDLGKKMVLLAGPRQAGKTTLALEIGKEFNPTLYLNYDNEKDRKIIQKESWLPSTELLIFDEIHKMENWKNYLKGVYDTKLKHQKILVTGSARLEIFNNVGDSLAGRFFLHRLMPLSISEIDQVGDVPDLDRLLERGGFPEPYLAQSLVDAKRWRRQYVDSLLRVDVLDFEEIHNLRAMQTIFELLRSRVGSSISYRSLAEDVSISPNTVKKYILVLEALYIIFRVTPFAKNIARSLQKEPKIYFFDTGLVKGDKGIQFENLVAVSLFKHVLARMDEKGEEAALHYLRTKERHEVDFALTDEGELQSMVEVKYANHKIGKGIQYFQSKYGFSAFQVVKELKRERTESGIQIIRALHFLKGLEL